LKKLFLSMLLAAIASSIAVLYQSQHTLDVLMLAPSINDDSEMNWTIQFDSNGVRAVVLESKLSSANARSKISFRRQYLLGGLRLLLNDQPIPLSNSKVNVVLLENDGSRKQLWLQNSDFPNGISTQSLTEDTVEALTKLLKSGERTATLSN
jgi:hypothetical protein